MKLLKTKVNFLTDLDLNEIKIELTDVNPQEFLKNFDWHKYEQGIEAVDETKLKEFESESFETNQIILFKSDLRPTGAVNTEVQAIALQGEQP